MGSRKSVSNSSQARRWGLGLRTHKCQTVDGSDELSARRGVPQNQVIGCRYDRSSASSHGAEARLAGRPRVLAVMGPLSFRVGRRGRQRMVPRRGLVSHTARRHRIRNTGVWGIRMLILICLRYRPALKQAGAERNSIEFAIFNACLSTDIVDAGELPSISS